jgi:hypothetical protein
MERNQHGRNLLVENNNNMNRISGIEFKTATMRLLAAGAAVEKKNRDLKSLSSDTNIVQHGIQDALVKLHLALEQMSIQDLSRHLVDVAAARHNDDDKMMVMDNIIVDNNPPVEATLPIITNALARWLGQDIAAAAAAGGGADDASITRIGADDDNDEEEIAVKELLALLWVMPFSVVAGTIFWAFAGLDTYDDVMTPIQIWIFEIVWVSRIIGCAIDNDVLCTAADDERFASSLSSLLLPEDDIQEEGPSL